MTSILQFLYLTLIIHQYLCHYQSSFNYKLNNYDFSANIIDKLFTCTLWKD